MQRADPVSVCVCVECVRYNNLCRGHLIDRCDDVYPHDDTG